MEQLLEMLLTGSFRLPFLNADLLALDGEMPKSDFLALLMLQRRGEATMSELAADLGAPLSTATGIGARLERRGLIERQRQPRDKRVILLRLTQKGQDLAAQARGTIDGLLSKVQSVLTPEEVQQLMGLVQKILFALQAPPAEPADQAAEPQVRHIKIEE